MNIQSYKDASDPTNEISFIPFVITDDLMGVEL
jgi:hypothetical protein